MKISLTTAFFFILLSIIAGGCSDNDGSVTQSDIKNKLTITEKNTNNVQYNNNTKKLSFAEIINNEKFNVATLDQEKKRAAQQYNNALHRPIIVSKHNQVIKNKTIYAGKDNNCGITISAYKNITISNVTIYHANSGICAYNAQGLRINNLKLVSLSAPATGPHCPRSSSDNLKTSECWGQKIKPADSRLGILLKNTPEATITGLSSYQASSGIYAVNSPKTTLSYIRCYDMRGPFPRGQCVQFNRSNNSILTTFYAKNYKNQSHSEDNINAYDSDNIIIKNGLINGNWSQNGAGVIADTGSDNMLVENLDLLHISNAAISVYSNNNNSVGVNFKANKIRIKDSQCESRHSSTPSSGGLMLAAHPEAVNPIFSDIKWFNHCRTQLNWCLPGQACRKNKSGSITNIVKENFTTRWTNE